MSHNDIHESAPATEANGDEPRPLQVNLSVSESDWAFLERHADLLKSQTGRRTIPMATAAYDLFRRGVEQQRQGLAA